MSDDEDFGFEYSDDDQEEDEVDVENQYYNSKGLLETDEDAALKGFEEVVSREEERGEYSDDGDDHQQLDQGESG